MKIGITGGIACGKSVVIEYIKQKGYKVYDADKISFNLTMPDGECFDDVIRVFPEVLDSSNKIDRRALGKIVFSDKNKLKKLEDIIHPKVIKKIKEINDEICFIEVPLLYEAKLESLFDKIIVVTTTIEKQIERLSKRNNLSVLESLNRINNQMDLKIKEEKADYVIYNNNDIDYIFKSIDEIMKGLKI